MQKRSPFFIKVNALSAFSFSDGLSPCDQVASVRRVNG